MNPLNAQMATRASYFYCFQQCPYMLCTRNFPWTEYTEMDKASFFVVVLNKGKLREVQNFM